MPSFEITKFNKIMIERSSFGGEERERLRPERQLNGKEDRWAISINYYKGP